VIANTIATPRWLPNSQERVGSKGASESWDPRVAQIARWITPVSDQKRNENEQESPHRYTAPLDWVEVIAMCSAR
jgi:hypothetical protein